MISVLVSLVLAVPATTAADTLVVCPQEFRAGLEPWTAHRQAQGHVIDVIDTLPTAIQLRTEIRRAAGQGSLKYLVLVGDADPAMQSDAAVRARSVPTHYAEAKVNIKYGSEPHIATDNWYADLDDDRVPELAVGRLTCDSAQELERLVRRIIDYETSPDFGTWRRQVHFVAGLGGFGPMADAVMQAAAKNLINQGIPAGYTTTMTYGSWQSPYCPDPRTFDRTTLRRLNEGSLFWVYMGHGQVLSVDEVQVPGGHYPILSVDHVPKLACEHGAPIACFLACYSGAFDARRDCLSEEMLRSQGGPVAVLCATRVTMPYAMSVLGCELLNACFTQGAETIGLAVLQAKRGMMRSENLSPYRKSLDGAAKMMSPEPAEMAAERAEHLDLFNLLGDPLLRIGYPSNVRVETTASAAPGEEITVRGDSPIAGEAQVELVVRRDRLRFQPPRRKQFDVAALGDFDDVYERANQSVLAATNLKVSQGAFETRLVVPAEAKGACHVRVFVTGAAAAAGAADIRIATRRDDKAE